MPKNPNYPSHEMEKIAAQQKEVAVKSKITSSDLLGNLNTFSSVNDVPLLNQDYATLFDVLIKDLDPQIDNVDYGYFNRRKALAVQNALKTLQSTVKDYSTKNLYRAAKGLMKNADTDFGEKELTLVDLISEEESRDQAKENIITNTITSFAALASDFLYDVYLPEKLDGDITEKHRQANANTTAALTNLIRFALIKANPNSFAVLIPERELDAYILSDPNIARKLSEEIAQNKTPWEVALSISDYKIHSKIQNGNALSDSENSQYVTAIEKAKKKAAHQQYYATAAHMYANAKKQENIQAFKKGLEGLGLKDSDRDFVTQAVTNMVEKPTSTEWLAVIPTELINFLPTLLQMFGDPNTQARLKLYASFFSEQLIKALPDSEGNSHLLSPGLNEWINKVIAIPSLQSLPIVQKLKTYKNINSAENSKLSKNISNAAAGITQLAAKDVQVPANEPGLVFTEKEKIATAPVRTSFIKKAKKYSKIYRLGKRAYSRYNRENPDIFDTQLLPKISVAITQGVKAIRNEPLTKASQANQAKADACINLLNANIHLIDKMFIFKFRDFVPYMRQVASQAWRQKTWKRLIMERGPYVKTLINAAKNQLILEKAQPAFQSVADFMVDFTVAGKNSDVELINQNKAKLMEQFKILIENLLNGKEVNATEYFIVHLQPILVDLGADKLLIDSFNHNMRVFKQNKGQQVNALQLLGQFMNPLALLEVASDPFNQKLAGHLGHMALAVNDLIQNDKSDLPGMSPEMNQFANDLTNEQHQALDLKDKVLKVKEKVAAKKEKTSKMVIAYQMRKVVSSFAPKETPDPAPRELSPKTLKQLKAKWWAEFEKLNPQANNKKLFEKVQALFENTKDTPEYFLIKLNKLDLSDLNTADYKNWFNTVRNGYQEALIKQGDAPLEPITPPVAPPLSPEDKTKMARNLITDLKLRMDILATCHILESEAEKLWKRLDNLNDDMIERVVDQPILMSALKQLRSDIDGAKSLGVKEGSPKLVELLKDSQPLIDKLTYTPLELRLSSILQYKRSISPVKNELKIEIGALEELLKAVGEKVGKIDSLYSMHGTNVLNRFKKRPGL